MRHRNKFLVITLLVFLTLTGSSVRSSSISSDIPRSAEDFNASEDFNLSFSKKWDDEPSTTDTQTITDIDTIVDSIPSFIDEGLDVFLGDTIPNMTFEMYYYRLNASYLWIYDDYDTVGAGDIFLRGAVNRLIDDDIGNTYDWTFDLGLYNDGDHGWINETLYEGWAIDLSFMIELYDDDSGSVDSYGVYEYNNMDILSEGVISHDYPDSGSPDAKVDFTMEVLSGPRNATADEILDAYKPYLFSDVETVYDDPAEAIYGRVIEGYDDRWSDNTTCLQYLYYFPYEYTGTDDFVHYWDYEMILIFVDFSHSRLPYRLVWDNGYYFGSSEGTDWIDGQDYRIYEEGANAGGINGTYTEEIEFNKFLWPLLGDNRELTFKIEDLGEQINPDKENWGIFDYGVPTFQATIDTSYHQFDLGDAIGTDPMDMNRDYPIWQMNDSIIRDMFRTLNASWEYGIHELSGHYTPNYAPFSWDVSQPFTYPYIFNNYPKVAIDINAYNGAQDSKSKFLTIEKDITLTLDVPVTLDLTLPKEKSPGESESTALHITLDESEAYLTIEIALNVTLNTSLAFWSLEWNTILEQAIIFNIGTGAIEFKGDFINFKCYSEGLNLEYENIELGDYCDLSGSVTSDLLGTIGAVDFKIRLNEMLKTLIGDPYSILVDLLVDDLSISINPILTGFLSVDIASSEEIIADEVKFNTTDETIDLDYDFPEDSSDFQINLDDIKYKVNFATNWAIDIDWSIITGLFANNYNIPLASWPDFDINIAEGTTSLSKLAKYTYDSEKDKYLLMEAIGGYMPPEEDPNNDGCKIIGFPVWSILCLSFVVITYLVKKFKYKLS